MVDARDGVGGASIIPSARRRSSKRHTTARTLTERAHDVADVRREVNTS